ncbi:MAG: hypothetical protein VKO64_01620 [Candidatus Sericytochromatia bacterium]|nr:hypothetical protein [Candidatus Sericytochromatia bacterium]
MAPTAAVGRPRRCSAGTGGFSLLEVLLSTVTLAGLMTGFMLVYRSQETVQLLTIDAVRLPDRAGQVLARLGAESALGAVCWPDGYQAQGNGANAYRERNGGGSPMLPNWNTTANPLPATIPAGLEFAADNGTTFGEAAVTLPRLRREFSPLGGTGFLMRTVRFVYEPDSPLPYSQRPGGLMVFDEGAADGVWLTGPSEVATMSFYFPDAIRVTAITGGSVDVMGPPGSDYRSRQGVGPAITIGAGTTPAFTILGVANVPRGASEDVIGMNIETLADRSGAWFRPVTGGYNAPGSPVPFAPGKLFRLDIGGKVGTIWGNWALQPPAPGTASVTLHMYPMNNEQTLPSLSVGVWLQVRGRPRSHPLLVRDVFPAQVSHIAE